MNLCTLNDVAKLSELQLTVRGENFLAYYCDFSERESFLSSSTVQNLNLLENTVQLEGEGTLNCCPALFHQL